MTRNLQSGLLLFMFAMGIVASASTPSGQSLKASSIRPSVLLIHCDQLSKWPLSCYAKDLPDYKDLDTPPMQTPNIDKIAENGILLNNFWTNSGVCTPSRASLQTGRFPDATGAYENENPMNLDERTLADAFNDEGYTSAYIGKWHLFGNGNKKDPKTAGWSYEPFQYKEPDVPYVSFGYQDLMYRYNSSHFKYLDFARAELPYDDHDLVGQDDHTYPTNVFSDKAIDFINAQGTNPYFLMVSIPDPHGPDDLRDDYEDRNTEDTQYVPPTVTDDQVAKTPRKRKKYCNMISLIDDKMGDILEAVEANNPNTIIIFTTDHGDYMGEYGKFGKNLMYSSANNIPFLIQWPGHLEAGKQLDEVVSNVDIFPTLMGLIDGEVNATKPIHGDDFSHILLGEPGDWKDEAIIYHSSQQFAGIATRDYYLWVSNDDDDAILEKWTMERNALFLRDGSWEEPSVNKFDDPTYLQIKEELINKINYYNQEDGSGASSWLLSQFGTPDIPTDISVKRIGEASKGTNFITLEQNVPNPTSSNTRIKYKIRNAGDVKVKVYNMFLQEVGTYVDQYQSAGSYVVNLDCSAFKKGIYFYSLTLGNHSASKKMLVL